MTIVWKIKERLLRDRPQSTCMPVCYVQKVAPLRCLPILAGTKVSNKDGTTKGRRKNLRKFYVKRTRNQRKGAVALTGDGLKSITFIQNLIPNNRMNKVNRRTNTIPKTILKNDVFADVATGWFTT